MREAKYPSLGVYPVKGQRVCIMSHSLRNPAKVLDILDAWDMQVLLVGTRYVYNLVQELLPKYRKNVRFRLLRNINCQHLQHDIVEFKADYLLSYDCHKKIPDAIVSSIASLALNFHTALLPLYKGASPHDLPIVNNDQYTGVTVHKLTSTFDCGDIILQLQVPVAPTATSTELSVVYPSVMIDCFIQLWHGLDKGTLKIRPNPPGYPMAPFKCNQDFWFDPQASTLFLDRFVRSRNSRDAMAFVLVPSGAALFIQEVDICTTAVDQPEAQDLAVGALVFIEQKALLRCGDGYLWITVVMQPDRGVLSIERYRRLEGLQIGDRLQLQSPATNPKIAATAQDKADWYMQAKSRYLLV